MAFGGRGPPLMPGMHVRMQGMPGMQGMQLMQPGYPMPPLMQQAVPMHVPQVMFAAQRAPMPPMARPNNRPQQITYSRRTKEPLGPPVTVFIGNITERAPDGMIRLVLNSCGTVHNWKRVQGASGRLQAFGFCEFGNPDAALRAIRLLHDLEVSDKNLVAKVDSKTQEVLEKYKNEKRSSQKRSPLQDEPTPSAEDYVDSDMKADDDAALKRIMQILTDYNQEMVNYQPRGGRRDRGRRENPRSRDGERRRRSEEREQDRAVPRLQAQEKVIELGKASISVDETPANLDGMEVEEEKKDMIAREIGKFRDQMKALSACGAS